MARATRTKIVSMLKDADGVVSGAFMSDRLGISRTAVWKQIRTLKDMGYPITATGAGYRLSPVADLLAPWEISSWASRIHYLEETDSTMNDARRLAREGCPHFTVVAAERQTGGRGRLQRHWSSPQGGLFFTVVLRPEQPPAQIFRCTFAASYELVQAIAAVSGIAAAVKWPNDLLVADRKVCGMLSEMETESDMVRFLNIGIGINVNNPPPKEIPGATSLRHVIGRQVSRTRLLETFLDGFHRRLAGDLSDIVARWKTRTVTIGRRVRVETRTTTVAGTAEDVDDAGALVIRGDDGQRLTVHYGDCFHVGPPGDAATS